MKINVVMKNEEKHNYCGELEGIDDINSPEDEEWARIINEKYTFGKPLNPIEKPKVVVVKGSPTSGNFGHAGRPGQVGGSIRGSALAGLVNRIRNLQVLDSNSLEFMKRVDEIASELGIDTENDFDHLYEDDIPFVLEALARMPRLKDVGSYVNNVVWESFTADNMKYVLQKLAIEDGESASAYLGAAGIGHLQGDQYSISVHTLSDNEWIAGLNLPDVMHNKGGSLTAVAAHEYAHGLDATYKFSGTDKWESAIINAKIAPSMYAKTSSHEHFAESMALMAIRPVYFKKRYPEQYSAIVNLTGWDPTTSDIIKEYVGDSYEELPERKFVLTKDGYHIQIYVGNELKEAIIITKGSPTSGNFGHAGRPGKIGGSAPGNEMTILDAIDAGEYKIGAVVSFQSKGMKSPMYGEIVSIYPGQRNKALVNWYKRDKYGEFGTHQSSIYPEWGEDSRIIVGEFAENDPNYWIVDIGGEKVDLNEGVETNWVDSYKDVKNSEFGKGYLISGEDKIADITNEFGGGSNDHPGFIAASGDREKFGLTKSDAREFLRAYLDFENGDPEEIGKGWQKIFNAGTIRIREFGKELVIESKSVDRSTLRRLQRLFDAKKLGMNHNHHVYWESNDTGDRVEFSWEEFLDAKYVDTNHHVLKEAIIITKGSPTSGNFGHAGRPGQVGGSAPAGGTGLETFDIDPFFKKLYDGILPEDSPEFNAVVDAFNQMHHLDPEMLDGLDLISTRDTNIDPVFKQNENCAGYYASPIPGGGGGSLREICLNSDYRNLFDTSLAHELGHHIEEMNNLPSRPDSQRMFEGITTMQPAVWEAVKMSTGLREYSRTNPSEMLADMFMLYQLGKTPQVQALENVFQQHARLVSAVPSTLKELFNGE